MGDLKAPIKRRDFVIIKDRQAQGSASDIAGFVFGQSIFVPVILMMIIIYSSQMVISAIAMEKQDKTLETLLTVPVSRTSIVAANMLAGVIVGLLSAVIYMLGYRSFMSGFTGDIPVSSGARIQRAINEVLWHRYGITHANEGCLPRPEITIAEICRDKGYRTGHFGKWHLGTLSRTQKDSNRGGAEHPEMYSPPCFFYLLNFPFSLFDFSSCILTSCILYSGSNMIAIIDYEVGNLTSVQRALAHLGKPSVITGNLSEVMHAERVIFPGVGAAGKAMEGLKKRELDQALLMSYQQGKPILGICLGTQIVMDWSEENNTSCLGLIKGKVLRFPENGVDTEGRKLKVPHMGWNQVQLRRKHSLFAGVPPESEFYFVHAITLPRKTPLVFWERHFTGSPLLRSSIQEI